MMKKQILLAVLFWATAFMVKADIRMPSIFSSNMVLQQQSEVAVWGWAKANTTVTVVPSWNKKSYQTKAGADGKWMLKVQTLSAGGPYEMRISDGKAITLGNILIGEVWLCSGQSNMEMPMKGFSGQPVLGSNMAILKSKNSSIRMVTVPRNPKAQPQDDFDGQWVEANPETVANFSATAYYFAHLVHEMIGVPVGLIDVTYGGSCVQTWMSRETSVPFEGKGFPEKDEDIKDKSRTPTALFNGMLHPVIGYGIRGAIWYQGETNYKEPDLYEELFPKMVAEWRKLWQVGEFPFYYCQIAPFNYLGYNNIPYDPKFNSAYLRDAQRKCAKTIPNSAMAVLLDTGEKDCIHPAEKQKAGERLALLALAKTYGMKGFGFESPEYKAIEIAGSTVVVSFDYVPNGLTTFGKEITTFEIAGADKRFYPATAQMRSKSIVLASPRVKDPVAVRYAWKDVVEAEIFSTEGLPLSSFRTDDW